MHIILLDQSSLRASLRPFSYTRPISDMRNGIIKQGERWQMRIGKAFPEAQVVANAHTENYLKELFWPHNDPSSHYLIVSAALVASPTAVAQVLALEVGQALLHKGETLAVRSLWPNELIYPTELRDLGGQAIEWSAKVPPQLLKHPWDLYLQAKQTIEDDFDLITAGRTSQPVTDKHTICYAPERIFIEEGVKIRAAVLNAEDGPIYIGRGAQIQEGALLHGTLALCEGAVANMGVKLRGDNIIGPYCKVGGEVANSVLFGYSNKGHDGYLGNSVLGEWCNLGADTNTSNLKNNYTNVKVRLQSQEEEIETGQLFCGLLMGDHSKAGINTMFNTGSVVGVGSNLFGGGYMPKTVDSFRWGGEDGKLEHHKLEKMLETEAKVMARRKQELSQDYADMLTYLCDSL